ncbi:MAG: DUF998 domain-containing protein [Streptosporangiaceae bacterium]
MSEPAQRDPRVISYVTLRRAVGYLGIALPIALAAGNTLIFSGRLQQSLSDYFYTGMRGVLVGGLCVMGAFLVAHHAEDRWERMFTRAAGIGAIGVGLFPTPPPHSSLLEGVAGDLHVAFGALAFTALLALPLWLFRRSDPARSRPGLLRKRVYLASGIVMLLALMMAGFSSLPLAAALSHLDPVFWAESAAIAAFSVAWLVRGRAILRDRQPLPARAIR